MYVVECGWNIVEWWMYWHWWNPRIKKGYWSVQGFWLVRNVNNVTDMRWDVW